jgi:flagellar basal-body rod modification protein FlgD
MDKPLGLLTPHLEELQISSKVKPAENGLGQEAFLDLMVAQLENQDPLNSMESGDFLSQIAQFGTVNGITELQGSFAVLASALQSS